MYMKNCYGYIRVSTVRQGEGVSLQEQKDAIAIFAERNNLNVIEWFEEKETAAKSGRPVFNRMLRQLRRGAASGLIMHKIDRSARNLKDWSIVSELPDEGIDVYVATESIDFTTRGGRLTADMLAVIAADYIRNLREEIKKGIRGRLKQGIYPLPAPLGYVNNGKGKVKTPCPRKAPLVREAFDLYATGCYSLRSLREEMRRRGLRNANGRSLSLNGMDTILRNSFYTGIIAIKRTGETYEGKHLPIVPVSLFQRVQDIKSGRRGPKQTRHNHLFRGLFRCGLCKGPMIPELQKGRVYYRCQELPCPTKTVREDVLDANITAALRQWEICRHTAERLLRKWNEELTKLAQVKYRALLVLRIEAAEHRLDRVSDLLIEEILGKEEYLTKKREISLVISKLKEELEKTPNKEEISSNNEEYIELMKSLTNFYENLNWEEKRIFVEFTFSNRTVIGREPYFKPYPWIHRATVGMGVPYGAPHRDANRTFEVPEAIQLLFRRYLGKQKEE